MSDRFEAITLGQQPERVVVVLASDYDAMCAKWLHQVDINDKLRGAFAEQAIAHDDSCEQEAGDPYCGCRTRRRLRLEATPLEFCRCGRRAVYLNRRVGDEIKPDPTPYCTACEYMPCATCNCVSPD